MNPAWNCVRRDRFDRHERSRVDRVYRSRSPRIAAGRREDYAPADALGGGDTGSGNARTHGNTTSYTQYLSSDGVKTPLSVVRTRNDQKVSQTFLNGCKYNSNLLTELFTRASLEQRSAEVSKKGYKHPKDTK